VHEIADAVAAWKGTGAPPRGAARPPRRGAGVYVPSLFRPAFDPATRLLVAMEPLKPGYEKVVRRVMPDLDELSTSAYERPVVPFMADGPRPASHRAPARLHARLPVLPGGHADAPDAAAQARDRPARGRAGPSRSGYERSGCSRSRPGTTSASTRSWTTSSPGGKGARRALAPVAADGDPLAELAEKIARVRKTGFTLAPEAAPSGCAPSSTRGTRGEPAPGRGVGLRERLVAAQAVLHDRLPEERDEDVVAIARLAKACLAAARRAMPKGRARRRFTSGRARSCRSHSRRSSGSP